MDWRQNMGVKTENEHFDSYPQYPQKEQKGCDEGSFTTITDITDKGRKVKNISVWCQYKGYPRWVSWDVCLWHRERNDPECQGCRPERRPQSEKKPKNNKARSGL